MLMHSNDQNTEMNYPSKGRTRLALWVCLALSALWLSACQMREQPKLETYGISPTFGVEARVPLAEAVPVGFLNEDDHMYRGMIEGEFTDTFPMEVTEEVLARGQERFEIFCTPCHGYAGYGDGVVSQEGFPPPASFHDESVRAKPVGHYVNVIAEGQNAMFSYAARVPPEDRWAIAAYIRALQFSQSAELDSLPADVQEQINSTQ